MKKMRKIIVVAILIGILSMVMSVSTSAAIGTYYWYSDNDDYRFEFFISFDRKEVILTDFMSYEPLADVVIPTYLGDDFNIDLSEHDIVVTSIFSGTDIKSVCIPECMTVSSYAFKGCKELETVEMYGNFKERSTDPYQLDTAGYAFYNCTKLKSVTFGDNVTRVPDQAFYGCSALEYINLNNVEDVGLQSFEYCKSLTTIEGGENIKTIDARGFAGCSSLKSISFPALEKIFDHGFYKCTSLESVDLPALIKIYSSVFSKCSSLSSINAPTLTEIEMYGFSECTSLKSVDFPLLTKIAERGFSGCTSLESVDFPALKEIGNHGFSGCTSLSSVNTPALTTIYNYGFSGCTALKSVDFPALKEIGNYGFSGCTALSSINFPVLQKIGDYAFLECTSLSSFDFATVGTVGQYAFKGCASLKRCKNYKTTSVPDGLFCDCVALDEFDFSAITKVGSNAFRNCKSLEIPYLKKATSIGSYAFRGCDKITTVRLNDATYGHGVYSYCTNLKNIYVTDKVGLLMVSESGTSFMGLFEGSQNVEYLYIGSKFRGRTYNKSTEINREHYADLSLHDFKNLKTIEIMDDNPYFFVSDGVVYYEDDTTLMLMCYLNDRQGEEYITPETDKIFEISPFAFSDTKYLKKVIFTKAPAWSVESIYYINDGYCSGDYAFLNSSVEEIVTPNGALKNIPIGMFKDSQIKTIDLSEAIFVDENAFENCSNLIFVELTLCTEIFNEAFMGCENLESVRTPRLNYIGKSAFSNCSKLKRINLSGVNCVYSDTFENCVNLEIVEFTEKANYIEENAFSNCPNLAFYCEKDTYAYEYAIENNIPVVVFTVAFQKDINYEYTGKEIRPSIIVALDDMALVENQDYILIFSNNTEIGLGLVKVHFIGNFEGFEDVERTFLIESRRVSTLKVEYVVDNEYSGEEIRPKVVVKNGDLVLVENVDYTITYSSSSNTGSMFFTITGIGNYKDSQDYFYNIIRRDIAEATVSKDNDMVYTGEQLKPKPVLTWKGFTLIENVDYEIRYFDNIDSGYGTMTIYGMGNFCGTQRVQFKIFGKNIENAVVSEIPDQIYTGNEITPDVTVTLGDIVLVKDTDYVLKYENNIEKGVATVLVSGIGNYSGVAKQTFNINKNSVYSFTVFSETEMTATYDGTPLKPEMEVYYGTTRLTEDVDYRVVLENNVNAGTATVTIIGMGAYEGERSYNFTILPCEITENDVSVTGDEITIVKNGETLVEGKDFTVTYSNNDGTGTATINGIGNYCETVEVEYTATDDNNQPDNPDGDNGDNNENGDNGNDNEEPSDNNDDDGEKLTFWQRLINFFKRLFGIK